MKRIFAVLVIFLASNGMASNQQKEIDSSGMRKLVDQQKVFHQNENSDYRNILLGEWTWTVKKFKTKPTYLYWVDSAEKDYWCRSFIDRLKKDVEGVLGIKLTDRMANRKGKPEYISDDGAINKAEKFVLAVSNLFAKTHGDWTEIDYRLLAGSDNSRASERHPALGAAAVLPLQFTNYPSRFDYEFDKYPGICLKMEDLRTQSYFDLVIRICRFVCDIPAEDKSLSEPVEQLLAARSEFKKALGM